MKMSRIELAVRVVLEFNEAFNRRDVAGMLAVLSSDCRFENTAPAPDGAVYVGKEAIAQFWQELFRDSVQTHIQVEDVFGLGFRCVMRWRYDWVDATGQKGHVRGVDLFQVKNGLICEKLSYSKAASMDFAVERS
jgi:ketosteroid isomerase-like protein